MMPGFGSKGPGAEHQSGERRPRGQLDDINQRSVRDQHELFDLSWTEFKVIVAVEDEQTVSRHDAVAGYQLEQDIPLILYNVPAREFVIETGDLNFVRRIMAVRNLAIAIHVIGARNIHNSPTVGRFLDFSGCCAHDMRQASWQCRRSVRYRGTSVARVIE